MWHNCNSPEARVTMAFDPHWQSDRLCDTALEGMNVGRLGAGGCSIGVSVGLRRIHDCSTGLPNSGNDSTRRLCRMRCWHTISLSDRRMVEIRGIGNTSIELPPFHVVSTSWGQFDGDIFARYDEAGIDPDRGGGGYRGDRAFGVRDTAEGRSRGDGGVPGNQRSLRAAQSRRLRIQSGARQGHPQARGRRLSE